MKKYLCVHGHFYQPPRENPWLEVIEIQDSASPYHDWNERINRECYAPNTASRALDADGRIEAIVNNFEKISFNIGPTLFAWLKASDQATYRRIIDADKTSRAAHGGHGAAMAQAYNHMIMPLASDRDKETQIKWGIADFESHFDRKPEGMWLPETAVDKKTLEIMAENGIVFTVLAQRQARAVRETKDGKMAPLNEGIDPSRVYKVKLDSGRSMAVFFYDGPISQAVAFERLLESGEKFVKRLEQGYSDKRKWDQLLHIATDGETFGHHHRFGEMALTYALRSYEKSGGAILTNYGEYLSLYPPEAEAEILENTSWSCAHGVERWRADCGCSLGTRGWNQKWRAPLREALDNLKRELDRIFEEEGGRLFRDPWRARNEYIKIVLDRGLGRVLDFLASNQRRELSARERVQAMKLLEAQRNGMLMYTSCGWFFDDVSGIETVQILKYACRAIQLCEDISGARVEARFMQDLGRARSNIAQQGTAEDIYRREVIPERAALARMLANHAIISSLNTNGAKISLGAAFETYEKEKEQDEYGETTLTVARAAIHSKITLEEEILIIATLCLGGADVTCFTRPDMDLEGYERLAADLFEAWNKRSLTELVRRLDANFKNGSYTLRDLFVEQRRKAVNSLFADHIRRFVDTYDQLFWRNRGMMDFFVEANVPVPQEFKLAAQYILEREIFKAAREIESKEVPEKLADLMSEMRKWGLEANLKPARKELEGRLCMMIGRMIREKDFEILRHIVQVILVAQTTEIDIDMWGIQNDFAPIYTERRRPARDKFYSDREFAKLEILLNFSYNE